MLPKVFQFTVAEDLWTEPITVFFVGRNEVIVMKIIEFHDFCRVSPFELTNIACPALTNNHQNTFQKTLLSKPSHDTKNSFRRGLSFFFEHLPAIQLHPGEVEWPFPHRAFDARGQ